MGGNPGVWSKSCASRAGIRDSGFGIRKSRSSGGATGREVLLEGAS
jgi:hypothetical protein